MLRLFYKKTKIGGLSFTRTMLLCILTSLVVTHSSNAQGLFSWGSGGFGRLGTGNTSDQLSPVQVGTATNWQNISAKGSHSLAIKSDGTLWAWGNGELGRLGTGNTTNQLSPVQVGTATNWQNISAGLLHSLAIKSDGTLWAWGSGTNGQLGTGNTTNQLSPVQVGTATDWQNISVADRHSLAIKSDGTLWAWGYGQFGQLGTGNTTDQLSPVQIGTATNWQNISAGGSHSLAIKSDGTLWAWGYGERLGTGNTTNQLSPVQVGTATNWQNINAGGDHSLAIKSDGTLWAWGSGTNGQLGTGNTTKQLSPVQIGTAANWQNIGAGSVHSLAIKSDGTLWAWGYGTNGRLGTGDTTDQLSPVQVGTATNWQNISTASHSLALSSACPPGDVTLATQAEVDQFIIDYPNCTQINGNLIILNGVSNLNGLSNIASITGSLDANDVTSLSDISGLSNLTTVGKNVRFLGTMLTNFNDLSNLTSTGGHLIIFKNVVLTNVDGLSNLTSTGGRLGISENATLTNVNGLSNLTSVGGYLLIYGNAALTNVNGLSNLTSVGEDIEIQGNAVLSDISALKNTTFVPTGGYGLTISNNPTLAVCNLPNFCAYLANDASTHPRDISGNLANCLDEVAVVAACSTPQCPPGDVELETQAQVDQFIIDYPNCTQIDGNLLIGVASGSTDITNLAALHNIINVTGDMGIGNNPNLSNIDGLSDLTTVGRDISIAYNDALTNVDGLNSLITVGGGISFGYNDELTNVNGLNDLTSIGGDYLLFINNAALTNLNGLGNVTSAGLFIYIADNLVLSDISALQNISISPYDTLGLTILNNPALAVCNLPNFCAYLANDASTHPRDISGNLANCLDEAAVVTACSTPQCPPGDVELETQAQVDQFIIDYPNCTQINGFLDVNGNDIVNLNGLSNIVSVIGNLGIYNTSLIHFNGLNALTSVGGFVRIGNNTSVININGLDALANVGESLEIFNNASLASLNGLTALTSVGMDIYIINNMVLSNVLTLQNTTFIPTGTYGLTIKNNPALAVCNLPNFCAYLANDASTHPRDISGNLANCLDEAAVVTACSTPVAGCTNVTSTFVQFPSYTYAPQCTGSPEDITGNYAETGEYSKIQLTANIEYTFSSSVTTDYITISNEDGTVIYAHGYSPLDWMPSSDEIVRFFLHLDDGCNTGNTTDWRSRSVQCDNLSVPDINMNTISFYPNPVNDILNLSYVTEMTNVSVVNLLGQTVISQRVNSDSTQIDMSSLPVGNYFVEITSEVGIKTIKVIKK